MTVVDLHPRAHRELTAWGLPIEIDAPAALLPGARALVARLERLWNPALPGSDLHRAYSLLGTMVTVEPETAALVELAARAAWRHPHPPMALHDVIVDLRRNRVGLPDDELLDLRAMVPVLTAALLVRYLRENGAETVHVRVGDAVRDIAPHAA
ncbi:hypothetical protein [Cryptosporangium aurantiacum]|uniref:Uncharacterized protein n=1 Tax=Cryptosporangium aurantiacum TaxID=134849 RepID=A0A1M7MPT9_9ACTN|nr:hypothetical protein [Cryptosporangium aurantiacum]SHM93093.1 hypothetical protein SAMN05443668_102218 [Cryptosporangium aurantiacum]